jgi:hypothetical protein
MKQILLLFFLLILSNRIGAQRTEFNWDTVDFETGRDYMFIDTSLTNIWHVCEPKKAFFDSAYSANKAIVTDSTGYYPDNNLSFFDLYIGTFNNPWYPYDTYIEITHKFDTDTLKDGGFISVSCDRGKTWMNIVNDDMCFGIGPLYTGQNLYTENDILFNGEPGFSGRSDGWIKTEFAWYLAIVKSTMNEMVDTMIIRFTFISDSIPSDREGWMIDDIRLFSIDLGGAIDNSYMSGDLEVYPNPAGENGFFLEFPGFENNDPVSVRIYKADGKQVYYRKFDTPGIIQISNSFQKGIYLVHIRIGHRRYIRKVIIQ